MSTQDTQRSNVLLEKKLSKYKDFKGQRKRVYKSFSERPKTMLQVAQETNILRANLCRYIAKWKKQNSIELVKFGICPITKHRAGFYYTGKEERNGK